MKKTIEKNLSKKNIEKKNIGKNPSMIVNSMVFQSLRECSLIDPGRLNEYYHGKTTLIYDANGNLVDRKFEQFCLYNSLEKIQSIETFIPREERFLLNESIEGCENVLKKQKKK